MIIKSLDDLQVLQLSLKAADEISAIIMRPCFAQDLELKQQLADCSGSIGAKISEGFGLSTDSHCAHFQSIARGSANEMLGHLSVARGRGYITKDEQLRMAGTYTRIGKMLTKWIQHLRKENRKVRS